MANNYKIAVLAGDGIGPEVMAEALKFLMLYRKNSALLLNIKKNLLEAVLSMNAVLLCQSRQWQPVNGQTQSYSVP